MRNTDWAYGMVIYAGHDTKLVQNSGTYICSFNLSQFFKYVDFLQVKQYLREHILMN